MGFSAGLARVVPQLPRSSEMGAFAIITPFDTNLQEHSVLLPQINQLSVKPQNVGDFGLDLLSWQTLPPSAPWLLFSFSLAGELALQNDQSRIAYFWTISKTVEVA